MKIHLAQTGKLRWVEKTPGHLKHFTRIRDHFPDSPIVCVFRDPRDVALSLVEVPWTQSTFLDGLLTWKTYFEYFKKFIIIDKNMWLIKFEELVRNPSEVCKRLCGFIKEEFDPGMLDTSQSAAGVGGVLEPYKSNVAGPVDPGRAFAWRNRLKDCDQLLADAILGPDLVSLGYPLSRSRPNFTDDLTAASVPSILLGLLRQSDA